MLAKLRETAPTVDGARLIATGASELWTAFSREELPGIIAAYMHGLKAVFAVSIGFSGIAFLSTLFIPWGKLPTHKAKEAPAAMAA